MTMPGKNPAANERPSKPCEVSTGATMGHLEVWEAKTGFVADGVGLAVEEGDAESLEHIPLLHE